jgi:hypothetical protein
VLIGVQTPFDVFTVHVLRFLQLIENIVVVIKLRVADKYSRFLLYGDALGREPRVLLNLF